MTTRTSSNVSEIQDAANAKWLAKVLEPARARVQAEPDAEAIDRMRTRVMGESAAQKPRRSIAA